MTLPNESESGRVVVVTGGAAGIGAEIVADFVEAGAEVVVADLAEPAADAAKAEYARVDITSDEDLQAMVAATVERHGRIDALVNCAAVYRTLGGKRPLEEIGLADWDLVMRVNARGTWQAIKAVVPAMAERGGHIVNISSSTARNGSSGFAHYVASKAAVEGLTRAAARELGPRGITVNAVAPGLVDDEATRVLNDAAYVAAASSRRAVPRSLYPADLVGAVRFFSGDAAGFVTGQVLVVDGGGVFV
ncbi:NAD(P)-dependent dehydrogenase, short-chain alcohol dehydrogenase family [Pseudonocardia ammonioxydans]|uniref:NAD(P)-dependent dehydrogenase, short-chain alcohol dehydrogenase family n=1 Tax=Pseudonocardia ammonioxydans TaxID=260086 RepID=A0A1I5FX68_PSUAM|nr:SDR family oxidoreductase [Pseudonocardia ammonioxydans]SFO28374.1 NAD(P)-dependent dehydrogenase, short-chain alcohol dehydrogenase family [Pseudonocardia ammonioxydans]